MRLEHQLEALLFSSGRAMDLDQLVSLTGETAPKVKKALASLHKSYDERDSAIKLFEEASAWKMVVKDSFIPLVRKIVADTELPKPVLETLAVIAFNKPALQSKVVDIRGGNAYEHIRELEQLGFVTKTRHGRTYLLKLSERFFDYFDILDEQGLNAIFTDVQTPTPKEAPKPEEREEIPLQHFQRSDEDRGREREFLAQMEEKLYTVRTRNDERDEDPALKPLDTEEKDS